MLSCSEEPLMSQAMCFWRTREGMSRFMHLVYERTGLRIAENIAKEALSDALVGGSFWTDAEANDHVNNAIDRLTDRLVFMGRKSQAFERFVCDPQPARHVEHAGLDRVDTREHEQPIPGTSVQFSQLQGLLKRHRAFGSHAREYNGLRK